MNMNEIPTVEDIRSVVKQINLSQILEYNDDIPIEEYVEYVSTTIREKFNFECDPLLIWSKESFPFSLYRARDFDTFTNINLIREHSYPPTDVTKMGRCNFPKHPVFYSSNNLLTALMECLRGNVVPNKKYCLSKWQLKNANKKIVIQNFLQTNLPPENDFNDIKNLFKENIGLPFERSFGKPLESSRKDGLIEYLNFLHDSFIHDNNYSLSATLSHKNLYAKHDFRADILIYPSVQSSLRGVNFALNPNFVEHNAFLSRLYVISVGEYNTNTSRIKFCISEFAEVVGSNIIWKNVSPQNESYMNAIKEDFEGLTQNEFYKNQ